MKNDQTRQIFAQTRIGRPRGHIAHNGEPSIYTVSHSNGVSCCCGSARHQCLYIWAQCIQKVLPIIRFDIAAQGDQPSRDWPNGASTCRRRLRPKRAAARLARKCDQESLADCTVTVASGQCTPFVSTGGTDDAVASVQMACPSSHGDNR